MRQKGLVCLKAKKRESFLLRKPPLGEQGEVECERSEHDGGEERGSRFFLSPQSPSVTAPLAHQGEPCGGKGLTLLKAKASVKAFVTPGSLV